MSRDNYEASASRKEILFNAGFSIERMPEPLPTDEILEQYSDYKDLFHKPDFLLLRVKK